MLSNILYISKGLTMTLSLYVATAIFSLPLGFVLALGENSKIKFIKKTVFIYTWVFRGTPLLLQLFFVYYGLPVLGITLPPFMAATLTFTVNYAAYLCEIFRGSIQGVEKGQYEAAKALGMSSKQTMFHIIIPQALRTALPPLSSEAVNLVKDTSLVSVIGMAEILRNSKEIVSREFTILPFILCGGFYLLMSSLVILFFRRCEEKAMYEFKGKEGKKRKIV